MKESKENIKLINNMIEKHQLSNEIIKLIETLRYGRDSSNNYTQEEIKIMPFLKCCHVKSNYICEVCNISNPLSSILIFYGCFHFFTQEKNKTISDINKKILMWFYTKTKFKITNFDKKDYLICNTILQIVPSALRKSIINLINYQ